MTPESTSSAAHPPADSEYRIVDLGKYAGLLWRRKFQVLACAFGCAILAYGGSMFLHPKYDATVRLMPPERKESGILASLSPSRNEGDLYLGLISSRTVADDIIEHEHLKDYFHTDRPSELRRALEGIAKITVDKDQFITVTVRTPEPETSVRIANAFPEALGRLNYAIAQSQAQHRLEFFAGPLEQEKNNLADAEEQLKLAQQKTGVQLPEAQVQLGLSTISALNQQITTRREQLAALETSSTSQNPQVIQLQSQISSLTAQRDRLQAENGGGGKTSSSAQMPALTLEVERKARDVKFHETLFEVLSRQSETAHLDDAYSPPIELVDKAVLPDEKSWPSRRLFATVGLLLGTIFGMGLACFRR